MLDYYFINIEGRPVAKSNLYGVRVVGKRAGKNMIVNPRGIIYTTRVLEDYEMMIGQKVQEIVPEVIEGYASLYVRVYQHGKRWIDVDNCFKAIQDGMDNTKTIKRGKQEIQVCQTGISNDKMFQLIAGERIHVENADEQRVEFIVTEYKGLFHLVDCVREHYGIEEGYVEDLLIPEL